MKINNEIDYSTRDYEGFRTDMIKGLQKRIPEYTDVSQSDAGIVLIELLAHGLDLLSYYNDKTANEVYLDTAKERKNIISLAKMLGYVFNDGRPSQFEQVFEITPQDEDFVIPRGYRIKTTETSVEPEVLFETDEDLVIPSGCTGLEQDSTGKYLYSVTVTQGYTIYDEVLGTSDGTPNQTFTLSSSPVIKDSISLMVTETNEETDEWTRVDNFLDSSMDDSHFTVTITATDNGIIQFGNGKSGKIPTKRLEGLVATYRVGGGEIGNVSAMTINQLDQKIVGIVRTFNPYRANVTGVDKEDDETIKAKAKSSFRATWGAITLDDYSAMCLKDLQVLDAESETGRNKLDTIITILPKDYSELTEGDLESLRDNLLSSIKPHKALGVDVYIEYANKVQITPEITVTLYPNYLRKDINYLVDCVMKDTFNTNNLKLGEGIHHSQIVKELMQIEGVRYVECKIPNYPDEIKSTDIVMLDGYIINNIGGI